MSFGAGILLPQRYSVQKNLSSLHLDFLTGTSLDSRVTFTRSTTATFFGSNGSLQTAAINAPRFNYSPVTSALLGLLIEEERTNSIRNSAMQGAVAGSPGTFPTNWGMPIVYGSTGLTTEIAAVGTENGIAYIDFKVSGTASGAGALLITFEPNTQIVASQNQVWTLSIYRRLIAGSFNGLTTAGASLFLNSYSIFGVFDGSHTGTVLNESAPTSAALKTQRATLTGTLSSATTARVNGGIYLNIADGAAIDITLRIGLPQLELGKFATSAIPTTTAAVTRAADIATMTGANFSSWYNATQGTFIVDGRTVDAGAGGLVGLGTGTGSIYREFNSTASWWTGTTLLGTTNSATWSSGVKIAAAYDAGNRYLCMNGAAIATSATTLSDGGKMEIGRNYNGSSNYLNGHIRAIAYYNTRLPNTQLQTLTAPSLASPLALDFISPTYTVGY
jgi:hypothetical protein